LLLEDPELARKFLKATTRGYEFCIENPEAAAELLLKNAPEIDREIAIASQKYLASQFQAEADRWGEMKEEVWKNYANWMFERKLIEQELNANAAFTNKYLPKK